MPTPDHPASYGPSTTALMILDYHEMLNHYIPDQSIRSKLISCAQTLLTAARQSGAPIFHCLLDKDAAPPPTSRLSARWAERKHLMATQGHEHPALSDGRGHKEWTVLRRPGHVSALKSPGLLARLRDELGIASLVVCGVSSGGCVLSTARQASDEDFVVGVVRDGCWDSKEGVHEVVMGGILPATAWVLDTEEAVRVLKGR